MINKEKLKKIAQHNNLDLYQQEKEYLLVLFLYYYYKHFQNAIFKGGTLLKFHFGLNRFSEDLDFNVKNPKQFKKEIEKVMSEFGAIGIENHFLEEEIFSDAYTCEIGFSGPLYTGNKQTQNKIKIDAGYRLGTLKTPEWQLIKSDYPETNERFLVLAMDLEEILVEKIIALFTRKKGRDLYDLWFLLKGNVKLNQKLLKKKKNKIKFDINKIVNKKEYERDLSRLTKRIIPYKQIKKEVLEIIEGFD